MSHFNSPKDLYQFWNCRYFRGKLPDIPVVWTKKLHKRYAGVARFNTETKRPVRIELNADHRYHRAIWQMTLLHEMVHIQQWKLPAKQAHGNKFNRRMKQLASLGAFRNLW